jgi:hypothetical protein
MAKAYNLIWVSELKHKSCAPDFPAQCAAALERLSALIEDASDRGSFGLAQSTSERKALVRILVLAAVTTKHGPDALQPHGAPGRSWLAWAADDAISTRSSPPSAHQERPASTRPRS